jgi:peptidoglycan/xylan/chitin deacetylase (PgdA/CDA1 family)
LRSRHDNALLAAALATLGYWTPSVSLVSTTARRVFDVRARVEDADGVALTFDDGPHPEGTPAVLDALDGRPAVFFLVAEQVERHPQLARRIVESGHEVGVHCARHRNLMRLLPQQVERDLAHAARTIEDATGVEPRLYRPPYGILTTAALRSAARHGWDTVLWQRDGRDWRADATAESIATRLLRNVHGGEILLLHDSDCYGAPRSWERTATALPLVLDELDRRGLRVVAIP